MEITKKNTTSTNNVKIAGIIAEYNPFHNGHALHLQATKKQTGCQAIIAIMSGHFTQRGEAAIFDKWSRAEAAILGGVDLVLELPTVFAVRSAQYFACGGVRLLQALGIVTHLCFGAEHADIKLLGKVAALLDSPAVVSELHQQLGSGKNYALALSLAAASQAKIETAATPCADIITAVLQQPNNVLAIEYLRALKNYAPQILPVAIPRKNAQHNDNFINTGWASATAIRTSLLKEQKLTAAAAAALPDACAKFFTKLIAANGGPVNNAAFDIFILGKLRSLSVKQLAQQAEISEGLEHRLCRAALAASDCRQLLALSKSKRYPLTRLQRILVHTMLGTSQTQLAALTQEAPPYARILAFNEQGRTLLQHIAAKSPLPLISKTASWLHSKERFQSELTPLQQILAIDTLASDIYALGLPTERSGNQDFYRSPIYVR